MSDSVEERADRLHNEMCEALGDRQQAIYQAGMLVERYRYAAGLSRSDERKLAREFIEAAERALGHAHKQALTTVVLLALGMLLISSGLYLIWPPLAPMWVGGWLIAVGYTLGKDLGT